MKKVLIGLSVVAALASVSTFATSVPNLEGQQCQLGKKCVPPSVNTSEALYIQFSADQIPAHVVCGVITQQELGGGGVWRVTNDATISGGGLNLSAFSWGASYKEFTVTHAGNVGVEILDAQSGDYFECQLVS